MCCRRNNMATNQIIRSTALDKNIFVHSVGGRIKHQVIYVHYEKLKVIKLV